MFNNWFVKIIKQKSAVKAKPETKEALSPAPPAGKACDFSITPSPVELDYKNLKLEKMNQSSPNFETPGGNSFCKIENITPKRDVLLELSDIKGASVIKPLITKDDFIEIKKQIELGDDKKELMSKVNKQDEIVTSSFDNQSRDTSKVVKLDLT